MIRSFNPHARAIHMGMADIITVTARAVAEAQEALDLNSMQATELMSGTVSPRDPVSGKPVDLQGNAVEEPVLVDTRIYFGHEYDEDGKRLPTRLSMMELGFTPNFYRFAETVVELRLALRAAYRADGNFHLEGAGVDADYSGSYGFDARLSSLIHTRVVPVPPPADLAERLDDVLAYRARLAAADETTEETT